MFSPYVLSFFFLFRLTFCHVYSEIGGAMMEYYTSCTPKMEDHDVNVRADVVGNLVIVATQLNVHDLSKERHFLKFRNAVTIKVRIALIVSLSCYIHRRVIRLVLNLTWSSLVPNP